MLQANCALGDHDGLYFTGHCDTCDITDDITAELSQIT